MHILYIQRGLVPPPKDARLEQFIFLSQAISGEVLLPVWWREPREVEEELGPASYPFYQVGQFRYHLFLSGPAITLRSRIADFLFYVREGRKTFREKPYHCIVTYGFSMTALAGIVLKLFTGARLVLEINSEPGRAYLFDTSKPMLVRRLMAFGSAILLHLAAWSCDGLRLLYPDQVRRFRLLRRVPFSVFHPFVPTSMARPSTEPENIVLSVGHPWFLKGADVLIRAFRDIAPEFPDFRLVVRGFFPSADRAQLERLAAGCGQIEIGKHQPYQEMLKTIGSAAVVAHPSRTEGMSRVVIEAMAAGKACIASDVGGMPYYLAGNNGLIVKVGSVEDLKSKLRLLLGDAQLRRRLSQNAAQFALRRLSEAAYVEGFVAMLRRTVKEKSA